MEKGTGLVVLLVFLLSVSLSIAVAGEGYDRRDMQAGEIFTFNAYNRLVMVSTQKLEISKTEYCGSFTVITTGSVTGPIVISGDEVVKLPKQLQMSSVSFTCKNLDGLTVVW